MFDSYEYDKEIMDTSERKYGYVFSSSWESILDAYNEYKNCLDF